MVAKGQGDKLRQVEDSPTLLRLGLLQDEPGLGLGEVVLHRGRAVGQDALDRIIDLTELFQQRADRFGNLNDVVAPARAHRALLLERGVARNRSVDELPGTADEHHLAGLKEVGLAVVLVEDCAALVTIHVLAAANRIRRDALRSAEFDVHPLGLVA